MPVNAPLDLPAAPGGKASAPERQRRPPGLKRRFAFYLVVAVLAVLSLSPTVLFLALLAFVAPAYILMAAPAVLLYLPILDWPYVAWRRTRRLAPTLGVLALTLILPVGAPLIENGRVEQRIRAEMSEDVTPPAPPATPPRTVAVADYTLGCDELCLTLLRHGAVDHVLVIQYGPDRRGKKDRSRVHTAVQAATCTSPERHPLAAGWCVESREVSDPRYDAVVKVTKASSSDGRLTPFSRKSRYGFGARQISVWSCPSACAVVSRQTQVKAAKVRWPLHLAYEPAGGISFEPELSTVAVTRGDADPERAMTAALGLDFSGSPRAGGVVDVSGGMPGLEALDAARAAARHARAMEGVARREAMIAESKALQDRRAAGIRQKRAAEAAAGEPSPTVGASFSQVEK